MPKSLDNLAAAFAGESQANRKYLAFAKRADQDGFPEIARLFRAAAEAETVHAHAHLRAMGGVKDTKENVRAAIAGEHHEFISMYPEFIKDAEADKHAAALTSFRYANAVEKIHHELYTAALAALESGKDLPKREVYVCPVCGNTVYDSVPDACPICKAKGSTFIKI
ncbi:rubrerythrin family protein [candidate division WOR-3 bacterium]|uniref:Rubrerythrin family protein n=1 Tax=candidate division WOR-3 bacterium TaxID=2052148 RepID=A0A937XEX6_UNCW3|nr:rubrerythrin family protein [candidate division WOR-3 bacterium]